MAEYFPAPGRNHLFVPGPTNIPERIMQAMNRNNEDHRSPAFPVFSKFLIQDVKRLFKSTKGTCFVIPTTGSGFWESALTNTLSPGDKILTYRLGQFSHLWIGRMKRLNFDPDVVDLEWGSGVDLEQFRSNLCLKLCLKLVKPGKCCEVCHVARHTVRETPHGGVRFENIKMDVFDSKRHDMHRFVPDHLYHSALRQCGESTQRRFSAAAASSLDWSSSTLFERKPFGSPREQDLNQRFGSEIASNFMIPWFPEPLGFPIALNSSRYFWTCALGGAIACGFTHASMTPVDVVKCNMQINPNKYKSISSSFNTIYKQKGLADLFRGWGPTFVGYSVQGAGKYGIYEFFKHFYSEAVGEENAHKYKTVIYLAASASAEFIADIGLAPFEAVKVRVQTQPGFAKGLSDGIPKLLAMEGMGGFYKGIVPLWGRQIPYTMMKFATFESTVEALYKHVMPSPKEKCSSGTQLGVSFAAGYLAGIACTLISQPADNLVSYLNNKNGATIKQAVKNIGMKDLMTRGLPLRIFMIGTLTGAQWCIYDSFKVFVGLPTTGGGGGVSVPKPDGDTPKKT